MIRLGKRRPEERVSAIRGDRLPQLSVRLEIGVVRVCVPSNSELNIAGHGICPENELRGEE